jgi:hypothetical protein
MGPPLQPRDTNAAPRAGHKENGRIRSKFERILLVRYGRDKRKIDLDKGVRHDNDIRGFRDLLLRCAPVERHLNRSLGRATCGAFRSPHAKRGGCHSVITSGVTLPVTLKAHPRAADLPRLWASGLLGELLARQGEAMVRITGWPSWAAPAPACRMTY